MHAEIPDRRGLCQMERLISFGVYLVFPQYVPPTAAYCFRLNSNFTWPFPFSQVGEMRG
jgi:hypothetical protein